jgi:hypothetical protein
MPGLLFYPKYGGSTSLSNISELLFDYKASHPRGQNSPAFQNEFALDYCDAPCKIG